jgi:hypothetical protein
MEIALGIFFGLGKFPSETKENIFPKRRFDFPIHTIGNFFSGHFHSYENMINAMNTKTWDTEEETNSMMTCPEYDESENVEVQPGETDQVETEDWIFNELANRNWSIAQIGHFAVASEADCKYWNGYATRLDQEDLYLFVFHTFRKRIQNSSISENNMETLKWLTDLYSGKRPRDVQINNLPWKIENPTKKNLALLYWHLEILAKTIGECSGLIQAGYLNLMSREESVQYVSKKGQYLLRVSNLKPNQLVLSHWNKATNQVKHVYLEGSLVADLKLARSIEEINGNEYVIYSWKNEKLLQWLNDNAKQLSLKECVLGQITLEEMSTSNYDSIVQGNYDVCVRATEFMYSKQLKARKSKIN